MIIAWTSSTFGTVDILKFLNLPQYKLSRPITELWHMVREMELKHVVVYENIFDEFSVAESDYNSSKRHH